MENEQLDIPEEIVVKKNGATFVFADFSLAYQRALTFDCLYKEENEHTHGYFKPEESLAVFNYPITIQGKQYTAVKLPEEVAKQFSDMLDKLYKVSQSLLEEITQKLLDGSILVTLEKPGYDIFASAELEDVSYPKEFRESSMKDDVLHRANMKLVEELGLQDVWYELTIHLYRPNLYFTDILNGKTSVERFDIVYNEYGAPIKCKVRLRDLLEPSLVEEAKKHQALVNERKEKQKELEVEVLDSGGGGSGEASEIWALVKVTDPQTKESLKFMCRNIFDVGLVINPAYPLAEGLSPSGLPDLQNNRWMTSTDDGKDFSREMTPFERKCVEYLHEFAPVGNYVMLDENELWEDMRGFNDDMIIDDNDEEIER